MIERPVDMSDDAVYQLVTVKRRYGGVVKRSNLKGSEIRVKSQYFLERGDFLISKRQIVHGACGIVGKELEGAIVSNEYHAFRAKAGFHLEYIARLVQLPHYLKSFLLSSIGVHIEKMLFKYDQWAKFEIPVPPLPEQKKIARILSTVDSKLALIDQQITAAQTLKKGLMQKLFSEGVGTQDGASGDSGQWQPHTEFKDSELGRIPVGWDVTKLLVICASFS